MLGEQLAKLDHTQPSPYIVAALFAVDSLDRISVSQYKLLMSGINSHTKSPSQVAEQIKKRGDLLILPELGGLGIEGNVAWVRHIWQVSLSEIAIKTSDADKKRGERLARLASPFRYRLTQRLAQVFSDIGLPDIPDVVQRNVEEAYGCA